MRFPASDTKCGGGPTIFKVRDCFENVAVCVERLWPADSTGRVPVRIQDDLCVDEIPGGYSLVQGLAKSSGGRHVSGRLSRPLTLVPTVFIRCSRPTARLWLSPWWYAPKHTVAPWANVRYKYISGA